MRRLPTIVAFAFVAGCAALDKPRVGEHSDDDTAMAIAKAFDPLEAGLARARAEQRDVLVLIAPEVHCCAEPGRVLTPALDPWRKDARLQSLSSRFVVVELTESAAHAFFERYGPDGNRADGSPSAWPRNPRPMPGAYRLAPTGQAIGSVALDEFESRERLIALLAN
jgi:hypothetical protein